MSNPNVALFQTLQSGAAGSITGSYAALGSSYTSPLKIFRIVNNTDGDLLFSFDGTNNHLFVPTMSFVLYDITSNDGAALYYSVGNRAQFYVKTSSSATTGSVYLEAIS